MSPPTETLQQHEETCTHCTTYPRAVTTCAVRQQIAHDAAIISTLMLCANRSDEFRAGVEWAMRKDQAFAEALRPRPTCNLILHVTPQYRPQDGCVFCGYVAQEPKKYG